MKRIAILSMMTLLLSGALASCTPGVETPSSTEGTSTTTKPSTVIANVNQHERFDTVGYFVFHPVGEKEFDFYLKSGYDTVEFCDVSWFYKPGSQAMEKYQESLKKSIELAQKKGLKAYVILLSTLEQWNGSADFGNAQGQAFDPADKVKMAERLQYIRQSVEYFKMADGFSLFAGDPGGVLGIDAPGGLEFYIQMGLDVQKIVQEIAPHAEYNLNLWALAQFIQQYTDPLRVDFWLAEGTVGRELIATPDLLGKDIGIEIPGHDYYRALALQLYSATGKKPQTAFPSVEDIAAIKEKGTPRYWAFSHALMPDLSQDVQFNTKRVYSYVTKMRELGLNGVVMGNVTVSQYADLYAYGRFANDSTATIDQVLREYAGFMATDDTADDLFEIFKFLNNYDSHQVDMDEEYTLPDLNTRIATIQEAITLFRKIKVNPEPAITPVESIEAYFGKIQARLIEINQATRPEGAEDTAAYISTFDNNEGGTQSVNEPALSGCSGKLTVPVSVYGLAEGNIPPIDAANYAQYGYIHYDVYAERDITTRSYVMLCSDPKSFFADSIWTYEFGGSIQLKAGWNHIAVKISKGNTYGENTINWGNISDYRILFWNDTDEPFSVYLDNFYISNYAENRLP